MTHHTKLRFPVAVTLLAVLLLLVLVACGEPEPSAPTLEVSPLATPGASPTTAPVAGSFTPSPVTLPTPSSADLATIGGIIVRVDAGGAISPMAEAKLFLAEVIRSDDGTPLLASVDEENSVSTTTDENGNFAFVDVAPDTYGLAIALPLGSYLIKNESGEDFLVEAEAGEVLDLGIIRSTLPY